GVVRVAANLVKTSRERSWIGAGERGERIIRFLLCDLHPRQPQPADQGEILVLRVLHDGLQLGMRLGELARLDVDAGGQQLRLVQIRRGGVFALELPELHERGRVVALLKGIRDLIVHRPGGHPLLIDVASVPAPAPDRDAAHGDPGEDPRNVLLEPALEPLPLLVFVQIIVHSVPYIVCRLASPAASLWLAGARWPTASLCSASAERPRHPRPALRSGTRSDRAHAVKVSTPPRPGPARRRRRSGPGRPRYGPHGETEP